MIKPYYYTRGFSLVELMVTLTIGAVLMMVAVPSFTTYQRNSQLTAFANSLLSGMNAARGEAMKRGMYAMVVPTDGSAWGNGWTVFVDMDASRTFNSTVDTPILVSATPPSYLSLTGNGTSAATPPYIMFDASGFSKTKSGGFGALTFLIQRNDVDSSKVDQESRRLIISSTGRARVCTPATDTTCTSTAIQ